MMARRRAWLAGCAFLQASGGRRAGWAASVPVEAERQQVLAEVVMQVAGDAAAFGVAQAMLAGGEAADLVARVGSACAACARWRHHSSRQAAPSST
jgi:hypothetical protein